MRYAIIADIHSNPDALQAVLDDVRTQDIDRIFCCGDLVGYYASPNEAIDLIREHSVFSIAGNHDLVVSGIETDTSKFSRATAKAAMWTKTAITADNLSFLRQLPRTTLVDDQILLFHGALSGTPYPEMRRLLDREAAHDEFRDIASAYPSAKLAFFGHVHFAAVYVYDGHETRELVAADSTLELSGGNRYLICPGSVCKSRDKDRRASYVIYDSSSGNLTFRRVEFDDAKTRRAARRAGLIDGRLKRLSKRLRRRIRGMSLKPSR